MLRVYLTVFLLFAPASSVAVPLSGGQEALPSQVYRDSAKILSAAVLDRRGWGISLHTSSASSTNIFPLEQPPRVVVDIPLVSAKAPSRLHKPLLIPLNESACCTSLRIAAHSDKIRVVLDLKSEVAPRFSAKTLDERVLHISLQQPEATATAPAHSPASISEVSLPDPRIKAPSAVTALRVLPPQVEPRTLPLPPAVRTETPAPTVEPAPKLLSPALTRVEFRGLSGGAGDKPHLRLETSHRPHYQILKRATDKYVLRVKDCAVSDSRLLLPYFPPQEVDGLNLVHPSIEGKDLVIELRTKRDARVRAVPEERAILVFIE